MGAISFIADRLSNVMSGLGTTADRSTRAGYYFLPVAPDQVEAAYRTSWLMRKIVDVPPLDMTRAWRAWQTEKDVIEKLEAEERRLQLRDKVKRALILARLWGGSAIIIGSNDDTPEKPLNLNSIGKGELPFLHVVSCHQISAGAVITNPLDPHFGEPEHFTLGTTRLHPSRVVAFVGQPAPEGGRYSGITGYWGDPLMQSIERALKNADLAQDGFAALIDEAKIDIIKIPDLMQNVGSTEYETRLLARLSAAAAGKSTWRALMLDASEEWEQKQISWAGIPDIITSYLQAVSGAADIPITRLLGQSPKGLQSTGDGEERDYNAMIAARQDEMLAPALDRIDEVLIRSALGTRPTDIWYKFNPLTQLTPKDAAEIEAKRATTIKTYADTGLIEDAALSVVAKNAVIESGYWPGSESAFEDVEAAAGEESDGDADDLLTEQERAAAKGGDRTSAGAGGTEKTDPPRRATKDAAPRTLYVRRDLLNADEFRAWAKAQGFETTLPDGDLHVTITYSKQPVDWMQMGTPWDGNDKGELIVQPGGARIVEPLGDKGAVVLLFASLAISWRHEEMIRNGASHDFPEYQPHVTISYATPAGLDLKQVEPFRGALHFGPEIFEELDDNWRAGITEDLKP